MRLDGEGHHLAKCTVDHHADLPQSRKSECQQKNRKPLGRPALTPRLPCQLASLRPVVPKMHRRLNWASDGYSACRSGHLEGCSASHSVALGRRNLSNLELGFEYPSELFEARLPNILQSRLLLSRSSDSRFEHLVQMARISRYMHNCHYPDQLH